MEKRLLIVDDEPRLTLSFKVIFESRGFWVQTASNGYDALEFFKKCPFKVVLSDIQMEGMGGIELMHALKQIDPCVQIIFLTGYASIETAANALKQNNVFEYLEKPVENMNHLYKIIDQAEKRYDIEQSLITQKTKAENEFAIFKNLSDSMEAIIYVSDMQTHELLYTNKKFMEVLGYDDPLAFAGLKCWQVIQKGQVAPCPFCTNKRLILPDGNPAEPFKWEFHNTVNHRWYSIVDKAITWHDNRIVRLETALDITEKKEHEKNFWKLQKDSEVSKRFESIGTLAGGIAHDFNNTLSTIMGNINLAQLSCSDSEIQRYLQIAEDGIMQTKGISSKLTAFAKGGKLLKTKINIEKLILQILDTRIDSEKVTCSFKSDSIPIVFYADQDQLKTAIENILQNSVESMDGCGRIDIAIKYREQLQKKSGISITISDSGCGITRDNLDIIFNPYFTTKPLGNRKSTGLGLSMAWSVIAGHGGNIDIESTVRKGTIVNIFLPVFSKNGIKNPIMDHA